MHKIHNKWYIAILRELSTRVKGKGVVKAGFRMSEDRIRQMDFCVLASWSFLQISKFIVLLHVRALVFSLIRNFGLTLATPQHYGGGFCTQIFLRNVTNLLCFPLWPWIGPADTAFNTWYINLSDRQDAFLLYPLKISELNRSSGLELKCLQQNIHHMLLK